ncbi:hypothetical protein JKP88DRAFT_287047 [Tribonema minus]|uniref:Uncharacterized protein n=1 Tax=Tribonema minus TaxID=303371 RepID=A0A836CJK2_9STRA|nr:hypothetical protein JKP88DRAFT_287047 [Tribonema minus]
MTITSIVNNSDQGARLLAAAKAQAEKIEKANRFAPLSAAQLAEWKDAPLFRFQKQPGKHQALVVEFYYCATVKAAVEAGHEIPTPNASKDAFEDLASEAQNAWTKRTASMASMVLFSLWSVVIPHYINDRSKGDPKSQWKPLSQSSHLREQRRAMYELAKTVPASDFVRGAPSDKTLLEYYDYTFEEADERIRFLLDRDFAVEGKPTAGDQPASQAAKGVASTYVRAMWAACIVLQREPHAISAVRPLTAAEYTILTVGHHAPEDLLIGSQPNVYINYSTLVHQEKDFVMCKELSFLATMTEGPFFSDLFMHQVFFVARACHMAAEAVGRGEDIYDLTRTIYNDTNSNTKAGFVTNLATVFGALKRSPDRLKPDSNDLAALRAYLPSVDLSAIEASGSTLAYTLNKYLNIFAEDFLVRRRKIRAEVVQTKALDRGGLKAKQAAGRLPVHNCQVLQTMISGLKEQVWQPIWDEAITPWLLAHTASKTVSTQDFLAASLDGAGDLMAFASAKGVTKEDYINLQNVLKIHLSALRSQVFRDSLVSEYKLQEREGRRGYVLDMTRAFKTCTADSRDGLPHLTSWALSEYESGLIHAIKLLRPLATLGAGGVSDHMFLDTSGKFVPQREMAKDFWAIGREWVGVPRLGPHSLRTMWLSWIVNNNPLISDRDIEALAAYVQVSRATMLDSYVTPSHNGPAQRAGQQLRDGGCDMEASGADGTAAGEDGAAASDAEDEAEAAGDSNAGRNAVQLGRKRKALFPDALRTVQAYGGDIRTAFKALVAKRSLGEDGRYLSEDEKWFLRATTEFQDNGFRNFKRWIDAKGEPINKKPRRGST